MAVPLSSDVRLVMGCVRLVLTGFSRLGLCRSLVINRAEDVGGLLDAVRWCSNCLRWVSW